MFVCCTLLWYNVLMKYGYDTYKPRIIVPVLVLAAGATACGGSTYEHDSLRTERSVEDLRSTADASADQPDRSTMQSEAEENIELESSEGPQETTDEPTPETSRAQSPASETASYITSTKIVGKTAVIGLSNDAGPVDTWTLSCEDTTTLDVESKKQDETWAVYAPQLCSDNRLSTIDVIILNQLVARD